MSECFRSFFIINGEVKECSKFDDSLVNSGKTIYEVIRIIDGVPLFLDHHIKRFKNSAALMNKEITLTEIEIKDYLHKLVEINKIFQGNIKFICNYTEDNTDYLFYFVPHSYPAKEDYESGVDTILYHGERDNPHAKVINKALRDEITKVINERKVYEAILVDREGFITEGSRSNIFLVKGDRVITSPLESVLPGVTRGVIISLLEKLNIDISEERVSFKDINSFDGLFITGTSPKVLPIRKVDDFDFNSSRNDLINKIRGAYDTAVDEYMKSYHKVCDEKDDKNL